MKEDILYVEKQKFSIWFYILSIIVICFFAFKIINQLFFNKPLGSKPVGNITLTVIFILFCLFVYFLKSIYLETKITKRGVFINFSPFVKKSYLWNDIKSISIQNYSPFKDYLGWGIRLNSKGTAYTINGNKGIRITLTNGKSVLVGTKILSNSELDDILTQYNVNL